MGEAKQQGDLIEDVVARLHEQSDVKIDKRPVSDASSARTREIDVLLTSYIAGYPIQIAIECKKNGQWLSGQ